MKRNLIKSIAILISVIFAFNSCKKVDQEQPADMEQTTSYAKMIQDRINNFRDQMNGTYKSGEFISLDSAIWDLEALITYDQAYPDSVSRDFIIKRSTFTLPVDQNHLVDEDDVQALYYDMLDTIDDQLSLINEEMKFLAFSDVELVEIDNENAIIQANNGYGFNYLLNMYYPFEEDDDWVWGTLGEGIFPPAGKCDGSQYGVSDGSDELEWRLNNPIVQTVHHIYTDIETFEVNFFNCYYNEPPQLPRVFWTYEGEYCMENEELTFFLEAAYLIITDYNDPSNDEYNLILIEDGEGARPEGKSFMSIATEDLLEYSENRYFHNYSITFGIPTIEPGGTN